MSLSTQFTDFYLATRQNSISDLNDLANEATRFRTYLWRDILGGLTKDEYLQSGTEIVDFVMLDAPNNFQEYRPTDNFTYRPTNVMTKIQVPWRFSLVDTNWTDHEIILNQGDPKTVFKKLRKVKDQATMTSFWEGMEAQLWATPEKAEMEDVVADGGRKPLSLRCFVTDDGLAPSSTNGGVVGSNWTTIQTVDITAKANFRNQVETYDTTSQATVNAALIPAFDRMWLDVQFMSPDSSQQYFTDTDMRKMKILASKLGVTTLQSIARASNDRLNPIADLGIYSGKTMYAGMPITFIDSLGTVDATAEALSVPKPRFRFMNFKHIVPIFHSQRFQFIKNIPIAAGSPFTNLVIRDTWRNILCRSRRQQGMVRGT